MSGFSFAPAATTAAAPTTGFGFGTTAPASTTAPTTGFGFGTTPPAATTTPAPATTGFGFGTTTAPAAAPATTGFGFGATTSAAPTSTGFGFGSTTPASTTAPAATSTFGFGTQSTAPAAAATTATQPHIQPQAPSDPPIRLEQTLSTLAPSQQKKIAFLDEMIRGQSTYNEYLSNQLQALYSSYPLFFQSNDSGPPPDSHRKLNSLSGTTAGQVGILPPGNHISASNADGSSYVSPKQLLQVLSGLYLSITTDSSALKELDQDLTAEENNIDSATRQLSILLNDPTYLSNYNPANNTTPTTSSNQPSSFGTIATPAQPQQNNSMNNPRVQQLSQFQQSSDLITVPSYYHWNKLSSFQKRLLDLQTRINTVSESLSTLGLLDINSVDISTLVLVLTETLQNQSMSLLSTAVAVSNMSKKVKAYKEQTERLLLQRGADQYTLNLLSQHRTNKKHLDSSKIPLTKPTTTNTSAAPSTLLPEKTQLIPSVLGQPQAPPQVAASTSATSAPATTPAVTNFGFGQTATVPAAAPTTGFGFGTTTPAAPAAPATTGFGFGTTAPASVPAAAAPTGFGFGTAPPTTAPTTGFGFGASPSPSGPASSTATAPSSTAARPGVKRNGRRP